MQLHCRLRLHFPSPSNNCDRNLKITLLNKTKQESENLCIILNFSSSVAPKRKLFFLYVYDTKLMFRQSPHAIVWMILSFPWDNNVEMKAVLHLCPMLFFHRDQSPARGRSRKYPGSIEEVGLGDSHAFLSFRGLSLSRIKCSLKYRRYYIGCSSYES